MKNEIKIGHLFSIGDCVEDVIDILKASLKFAPEHEIVAVLNGPVDGVKVEVEKLLESNPLLSILDTGANLGHAGGGNAFFRQKKMDVGLVIDSDCIADESLPGALINLETLPLGEVPCGAGPVTTISREATRKIQGWQKTIPLDAVAKLDGLGKWLSLNDGLLDEYMFIGYDDLDYEVALTVSGSKLGNFGGFHYLWGANQRPKQSHEHREFVAKHYHRSSQYAKAKWQLLQPYATQGQDAVSFFIKRFG